MRILHSLGQTFEVQDISWRTIGRHSIRTSSLQCAHLANLQNTRHQIKSQGCISFRIQEIDMRIFNALEKNIQNTKEKRTPYRAKGLSGFQEINMRILHSLRTPFNNRRWRPYWAVVDQDFKISVCVSCNPVELHSKFETSVGALYIRRKDDQDFKKSIRVSWTLSEPHSKYDA